MKHSIKAVTICIGLVFLANAACAVDRYKTIDVKAARKTEVWHAYEVEIDCSLHAVPAGRVAVQPSHGRISEGHARVPIHFDPPNPRVRCNNRKVEGLAFYYTANPGFIGRDTVAFNVATSYGSVNNIRVDINVK